MPIFKRKDPEKRKAKKESAAKLMHWRDKFQSALNDYDTNIMDDRELIYNGTHDVDPNINDGESSTKKLANNVYNIVYEFVESQIDTTIPQPTVEAKRKNKDVLAKMIEDSIKNDLLEMNLARINDENERITPVQGLSFISVMWNPDFKHQLYMGEIELDNPHPKQLIPQPGIYRLQDMDYFFVVTTRTKNHVKERYGVELGADEGQEYAFLNNLDDGNTPNDDLVDVITAWYRDEDGDVGKYVWANETELQNLPKFYYRRVEKCTDCGQPKEDDICNCGNDKFKEDIETHETLLEPVQLLGGKTIEPGTKIPYFVPKEYPLIMRINVPVNFHFGGQSDVDVIRDQQDALKKVVTVMEEKILRGGYIIKALEDHRVKLTNDLYQVVRGNITQLQVLSTENLTADILRDLEFAKYLYQAAQSALGVTDSWMGKNDPSARSGVAKQIQVQQTGGRLQSKAYNKFSSYSDLFRLMFVFKLAYYDELRPYLKKTDLNQNDWGEFDKYLFLEQDEAGEWYYNTDFLFTADAGAGIPKDKMWLFEQIKQLYQLQAVDAVGLWTILEGLRFPHAAEMKNEAIQRRQLQEAAARAEMEQQMAADFLKSLPPEVRAEFDKLSPEMQNSTFQAFKEQQSKGG